jgi:hypothetical protein
MANALNRKSQVKVTNNTTGSLSFKGIDEKRYFFPKGGSYKLIDLGVIEGLYNECEKMIAGGYIIFDDIKVYDFLDVSEDIYKKLIPLDKIEEFLNKDEIELKEVLEEVPNNIKSNVATVAKQKGIDSRKKIKAIKDSTGFDVEPDDEK